MCDACSTILSEAIRRIRNTSKKFFSRSDWESDIRAKIKQRVSHGHIWKGSALGERRAIRWNGGKRLPVLEERNPGALAQNGMKGRAMVSARWRESWLLDALRSLFESKALVWTWLVLQFRVLEVCSSVWWCTGLGAFKGWCSVEDEWLWKEWEQFSWYYSWSSWRSKL